MHFTDKSVTCQWHVASMRQSLGSLPQLEIPPPRILMPSLVEHALLMAWLPSDCWLLPYCHDWTRNHKNVETMHRNIWSERACQLLNTAALHDKSRETCDTWCYDISPCPSPNPARAVPAWHKAAKSKMSNGSESHAYSSWKRKLPTLPTASMCRILHIGLFVHEALSAFAALQVTLSLIVNRPVCNERIHCNTVAEYVAGPCCLLALHTCRPKIQIL